MKMTLNSLTSVPYVLLATQAYFPSSNDWISPTYLLVVFVSVVEFLTNAMYTGGVPVAEQVEIM